MTEPVPVEATTDVNGQVRDLLRRVAARGLPGALAIELPPDRSVTGQLVAGAAGARLTGPLLAAVDAGEVDLPVDQERLLAEQHRTALFWCLQLEHHLLEVDTWFRAAGVPFLVLKGSATAHLDLVDPSERTWADLDLLVPPAHLDRALATLVARGLERESAEVRPGWDRRFGKSVATRYPDGMEVDVHRSLCDGAFGVRIPLDHLHHHPATFELGGRRFRALGAPQRVLHAAYHAVVGSRHPTLSNLRDIAGHLTRGAVPLDVVVAEARRWRGEAVLAAGIRLARAELVFEAPTWFAWADAAPIDARDQVLVSRLREGEEGLARHRFDVVRELRSPRDRLTYLRAVAFPSAAHLRSTGLRATDRYRRWAPHLLRRTTVTVGVEPDGDRPDISRPGP